MHLRHDPPASATVHDGVEYVADESGTFDLPDDVARVLLKRAEWTQYLGEAPAAPDHVDADSDRVAELEARVSELESELAKANERAAKAKAPKAKPEPKAKAEKSDAPAADGIQEDGSGPKDLTADASAAPGPGTEGEPKAE